MDDPHAATGTEGEGEFPQVLRVEPGEKFSAHKSLSGTCGAYPCILQYILCPYSSNKITLLVASGSFSPV